MQLPTEEAVSLYKIRGTSLKLRSLCYCPWAHHPLVSHAKMIISKIR